MMPKRNSRKIDFDWYNDMYIQAHKLLEIKTVYEPFFTLNFTGFYRTYVRDTVRRHYSDLVRETKKITLPTLGWTYGADRRYRGHPESTNAMPESIPEAATKHDLQEGQSLIQ